MIIEQLKIKNYKVFEDATVQGLRGFNVFIGANGSGKSTLLDVLDFLRDALKNNVTTAVNRRGGFDQLVHQQKTGEAIAIDVYLSLPQTTTRAYDQLIYAIEIIKDGEEIVVQRELLKRYSTLMADDRILLEVKDGYGNVANKKNGQIETILFELEQRDQLCIGIVGQVQGYPAINRLRQLLSEGYLFNEQQFGQALARVDNPLAQLTKDIHKYHPAVFEQILEKLTHLLPHIGKVEALETEDDRLLLKFKEGYPKNPFLVGALSEGTLRVLVYLVLLHNPHPHPTLAIETPEQYLHSDLLATLVEELRGYAARGGQLFVTTHSPDLVSALQLSELFGLRQEEGKAAIYAIKEDDAVRGRYESGEPLGRIWK